ncbi:MAG: glycosyltransferase family 2 protein [Bacteroidota bacterium]
MPAPTTLSVIIEWENVRLSELDRAERMLEQLLAQLRALFARYTPAGDAASASGASTGRAARKAQETAFLASFQGPAEVLVMFNSSDFSQEDVEAVVGRYITADNPDVTLRYVGREDLHYYDMKNAGAEEATGDYILFLDSDVVPEPGWLDGILGPLARDYVDAVGGYCYIDPEGLVGRAFTLSWFFDPPASGGGIRQTRVLFANNMVLSRELFLRYQFPPMAEGVCRRSCVTLSHTMVDDGVGLYKNPKARISHPAPNGLSHILTRAMSEGRDNLFFDYGDPQTAPVGDLVRRYRQKLGKARSRIRTYGDHIGLSRMEVPLVYAIAGSYYTTYLIGAALTKLSPSFMTERFQV